jgi:hypothetical protein
LVALLLATAGVVAGSPTAHAQPELVITTSGDWLPVAGNLVLP